MALILAAAASLTLVPPPRAGGSEAPSAAAIPDDGFVTVVKSGDYSADIQVTPAKPGENMVMVSIKDLTGAAYRVSIAVARPIRSA